MGKRECKRKERVGRVEGKGSFILPVGPCVLSLQLDVMEQSSRQLEDEKRELLANLNVSSRH